MRVRAWLSAFGILLLLASCNTWQRNVTVEGISYEKFRYTGRERESDYSYSIGMLAEITRVGGAAYKGYLHVRGNGTVSGGILAEPLAVNGLTLPEDSWVSFSPSGWLETCTLPKSMVIQGHLVLGMGGGVKGAHVSFYESGALRLYFSKETVTLGGIPCKGGLFSYIELHPDGRLKKCTLAEDTEINGVERKKGSVIELL